MSLSHRSRSRRHGFTLVELLVVIAIISVLVAILFPAFTSAREKARQIACLSNEKQIGLAVMQYAQDYDENIVPGMVGDSTSNDPGVLTAYLVRPAPAHTSRTARTHSTSGNVTTKDAHGRLSVSLIQHVPKLAQAADASDCDAAGDPGPTGNYAEDYGITTPEFTYADYGIGQPLGPHGLTGTQPTHLPYNNVAGSGSTERAPGSA